MEKIIDIEDRIPTLREKRKKRTNRKFIVLVSLFFLTLFLLLYFQSPYSEIKTIKITGSELVQNEEYLELSDLKVGNSMWGFRSKEVEKDLLQQKWIKNAEVKRQWLTTVEINLQEWDKVAYISEDQVFYPMLENGYVFKKMSTVEPIDAPVFLAFDDEKLRKRLLKELGQLKPTVLALISQINATPTSSDPYAITLFMNDGYEVRAEITSLSDKLNYYPSIVAQIESTGEFEKGIIDIEVGSYYRSYSDEYSEVDFNIDDLGEEDVEEEEQDVEEEEQDVVTDEESIPE